MKKKDILALDDVELDKVVKIAGTQYDRKRKITDKQIKHARKLLLRGKTLEYIANKLKLSVRTIRYHVDEAYRAARIAQAYSRKASAACKRISSAEALKDRVEYKRKLIARGKIKI